MKLNKRPGAWGVAVASVCMLAAASAARAATGDYLGHHGWSGWWLPTNYSKHGVAIDRLFNWVFGVTMVTFVLTEVVLVVFLIKYRRRAEKKKGIFVHGNTRLEITWTIIPALIMLAIALVTKGIWDGYKNPEWPADRPPVELLVVGQQFQWNVVYPGPDGKLGRYLVFPQPTDPKFRRYSQDEVVEKISNYIKQENPLGRDENWGDPEAKYGQDDDYAREPGRAIIIPAEWPVRIHLTSKDVIHDFFLPNFRVKLDAVPGMHGIINFETTADSQSTADVKLDDPELLGKHVWIDQDTPGAKFDGDTRNYFVADLADASRKVHSRDVVSADNLAILRAAGLTQVSAVMRPFEVVCAQLCGDQHYTMRDDFYVVSKRQFDNFMHQGLTPTAPAPRTAGTAPTARAN